MDKAIICFLLICLAVPKLVGQEPAFASDGVEQWLETLAEEGYEVDDDETIQILYRFAQYPVNLNDASRETLSRLFFLTDIQIENLQFYLYENGPMLTIYELQGVEGFDEKTIRLLLPFVKVVPIGQPEPITGLAVVRAQMPIETPVGYAPDGAYQGSKHKLFSKAEVDAGSFRVGLSAEKDAGEPLFTNRIKGFDHQGAFVEWNPDKFVSKVVVGDYRLVSGQGLALSSGMSMGKGAAPTNIRVRNRSLYGYASSDEVRFFRGAALEMALGKHFSVTPFLSQKNVDGSYSSDSLGITSVSLTGLHRTRTEMARRHNIGETMAGSLVGASFKRLFVEGGYYRYALEKPILPSTQLYSKYDFTGDGAQLAWVAYTQMLHKAVLCGEWATMDFGRSALSQSFTWEPDGKFALALRFQTFALGYWSPYMSPGARNVNPSGETNVYVGFRVQHSRKLESTGYAFFYGNRWLRYQVDAPTDGYEGMWRMRYETSKSFLQTVQVKWRQSSKNLTNTSTPAFPMGKVHQYNFRWNGEFLPAQSWRLVTRGEYVIYSPQNSDVSRGVMLNQDVVFRAPSGKWGMNVRYGLFNTDDYNSRIYVYEPDVRYAFSVPSWSGQGTRAVMVTRWSPSRSWDVYFRWSNVHYAGKSETGSGYDLIRKPFKNEIKLQVVYSFWRKGMAPKSEGDMLLD